MKKRKVVPVWVSVVLAFLLISGIVLACTMINFGVTGTAATASSISGMSDKIILAVVFFIMACAKYQDKTVRGTK